MRTEYSCVLSESKASWKNSYEEIMLFTCRTLTIISFVFFPTLAWDFETGEHVKGNYAVSGGECLRWFIICLSRSPDYQLQIDLTVYDAVSTGWTITITFCSGASNWQDIQVCVVLELRLSSCGFSGSHNQPDSDIRYELLA